MATRGHIRERRGKRGTTWIAVVPLPKDPVTGKRRQKWVSGLPSKAAANRTLTRLLAELDAGTYSEPSRLTVGDFLARWVAEYVQHRCRPRTARIYSDVARDHLIPNLGALPLAGLKAEHIEAWLGRATRKDGGKLAPSTAANHYNVLRRALRIAVRWELLSRSPMEDVDTPLAAPKERPVLTPEQARLLLQSTAGEWVHAPLLLALACGLRAGEALALRWQDVDLEAGCLTVNQSLTKPGKKWEIGAPKSRAGRRTIPIPAVALPHLRALRAQHLALQPRLAGDFSLVCCGEFGAAGLPERLRRAYRRALEKASLPWVRYHDLRRTHSSFLLSAREPPHVVAHRLGHSSPAVTLALYARLMPGDAERAAAAVDGVLKGEGL